MVTAVKQSFALKCKIFLESEYPEGELAEALKKWLREENPILNRLTERNGIVSVFYMQKETAEK